MLDTRGLMKKDNLSFAARLLWLLVRHRLSPTTTDNILTLDRAVFVAILVAGLEIDVEKLLISFIHERAFKIFTTYPFQ